MRDMGMIDIDYREVGVANTWIMLRGLGRESAHWMDFVSLLRQHIPQQRIECIDWLGNGEYTHLRSPCTISEGVAHLRNVCAERKLPPPYVLVGISMGGMAAIDWLAHFPEEISHVHAINTSIGGISYWYERLRFGSMLKLLTAAHTLRSRENMVAELTLSPDVACDEIVKTWLDIANRRPVSRANMLRQMWSAARFSVRKPVHTERLGLYVSDGDRLVSPKCSRDIAWLWNVEIVAHPAAGHDVPLDDGQWLLQHMQIKGCSA